MLRNALAGLLRARPAPRSRASGPTSSCSCIPGISTRACSARSRASAGCPTVLDVFISLYDTVVVDRGLRSSRSPIAFATRALDTLACWSVQCGRGRHAGARRLLRALHAPRPVALRGAVGRCRRSALRHRPTIPATTRRSSGTSRTSRCTVSRPSPAPPRCSPTTARTFRLVGDGQQRAAAEQLARELGLTNIEFVAPVPESELPARDRPGVDLPRRVRHERQGRPASFPTRCSSARPSGRAVVTAATPAVINAFGDALVTVPVGDPTALADAVRELRGPKRLAVAGAPVPSSSSTTPKPPSPTSSATSSPPLTSNRRERRSSRDPLSSRQFGLGLGDEDDAADGLAALEVRVRGGGFGERDTCGRPRRAGGRRRRRR